MKKGIISAVIAVIVVAIGAFAFFRFHAGPASFEAQSQAADTPVIVTTLEQNVFLKDIGAAGQRQIVSVASTSVGSTVITSPTGRAILQVDTEKAVLDYNTETVVATHAQKNQTSVELASGELWARIEKVFGKGEFYEIKTKNAVAVVRGTSFGLTYHADIDATTLTVATGTVSFYGRDEATGETLLDTEIKVAGGNKAMRTGNTASVESGLTGADKGSAWFLYNNPDAAPITPPKNPASTDAKPMTAAPVPAPAAAPVPAPEPVTSVTHAPGPQIKISGIDPSSAVQRSNAKITISGSNFSQVKRVYVGENNIAEFLLIDSDTIEFGLPRDIAPGTYDLRLTDNVDNIATKSAYFTVTAIEPTPPPPTPEPVPPSTYSNCDLTPC